MAQASEVIQAPSKVKDIENKNFQFSTFIVANRLYGIDVTRVQEIVRSMIITPIPLAPDYVRGLINLRGQVSTAIGLRQLFGLHDSPPEEFVNVVCKVDGSLISLQVDEIGDVIEVSQSDYEQIPLTIPENIRKFMSGIYKISGSLLSTINVDSLGQFLNNKV